MVSGRRLADAPYEPEVLVLPTPEQAAQWEAIGRARRPVATPPGAQNIKPTARQNRHSWTDQQFTYETDFQCIAARTGRPLS